jgi:hypothetical protein
VAGRSPDPDRGPPFRDGSSRAEPLRGCAQRRSLRTGRRVESDELHPARADRARVSASRVRPPRGLGRAGVDGLRAVRRHGASAAGPRVRARRFSSADLADAARRARPAIRARCSNRDPGAAGSRAVQGERGGAARPRTSPIGRRLCRDDEGAGARRSADESGLRVRALPWPPPGHSGDDPSGPSNRPSDTKDSVFTTLPKQLGLRLDPKKGLVEILVVERAERLALE